MIYVLEIKERAIGKGRPRINTITHTAYTPEKTKVFEEIIKWNFINKYDVGIEPSENPFRVKIIAEFQPPARSTKKRIMILNKKPFTKKPDIDNISKAILDALNGLAYKDDNQVTELIAEKKYALEDRITIVLEEIIPEV